MEFSVQVSCRCSCSSHGRCRNCCSRLAQRRAVVQRMIRGEIGPAVRRIPVLYKNRELGKGNIRRAMFASKFSPVLLSMHSKEQKRVQHLERQTSLQINSAVPRVKWLVWELEALQLADFALESPRLHPGAGYRWRVIHQLPDSSASCRPISGETGPCDRAL
jgi:hypothetical protein